MRKLLLGTIVLLALCSCNPVFPDYELDNFWKLEQIDYKQGETFSGVPCDFERTDSIYFGFARNLVQIQNLADRFQQDSYGFSKYGKIVYTTDSLRIDYSVYKADDGSAKLLQSLNKCGVEDYVTAFSVDRLDKKYLVLSNDKVILNFRRW